MEWKAIKQIAKTYDVDITDWLLSKTLTPTTKPKRKAIYARAVVLMLEWVLSGEQGSLSRYLKDWGLNVNLAGVAVSEYRRYVYE